VSKAPATTPAQLAELLRQLAPLLDGVARQIDMVQAHEGRIAELEAELPRLRQVTQEAATRSRAVEEQLAKMSEAVVHRLTDREHGA